MKLIFEPGTRRTFALCIVFLVLTACAFGQLTSGDLVGTVFDPTGAGVPNANVEAVNQATGVKSSTKTAETGQFRFTNLPVGLYTVTSTAGGFNTASLRDVGVELNKVSTANVTMQVGSLTQSVDVQEAGTTIDTTTAQIQNTYETKMVQDLPTANIGLGVINLSLLNSGVASSGGVGAGTGPSVGGQRPRNNNFTVEGIDNNNKSVTGPLLFIPNDAVENFTLLQNQFAPEYGHSSGGQFNTIVKSGTNVFHGAIYDYLQNRNLNAVDQALANQKIRSNPRYDQNRLGATFGGPIIKNKLFFFGNYEYNPVGQSATPAAGVLTPTTEGFAKLAAVPGLSQTNLSIFKQYVTPAPSASDAVTVNGVSIPVGILPLASPNYQNNYYAVAAIDYSISDRDQLRGRYIYNKSVGIDTAATLPAFYQPTPTTYYLFTLTEYHNFTPNLTNEFRLGYNRYNNTTPAGDFKFPGLDQFPTLEFDELNLSLGPDGNAPQYTIQNLYQATDNLSWIKGRHTIKVGFEGRKFISPQSFTQRARGDYDYSSLDLFLRDRTPDSLSERSLGNPIYYGDQTSFYSYINDTWRIRPNFTLNLGLRHEFTSVPFSQRLQVLNKIADVPGVLTFREPQPQYKNFAPRIGIAYSPGTSGTTSVRAGFGMAYDVLYDNIGILSLPPQLSTTVDASTSDIGDLPNFLKNGGILPTAGGVQTLTPTEARAQTANYIPDQKLPYSIQWNVGVQHVFHKDYTFEARYVGTRGVHLNVQDRINRIPKVTPEAFIPTFTTTPSAATLAGLPLTLGQINAKSNFKPEFAKAGFDGASIVEFAPIGNSTYHGLALQLDRRFSSGLTFKSSYTWSHLIDDSTADFFTTLLTPRRPQDFQNLRADRASSALDRRHRFSLAVVYDVTWFKNSNWLMKNIIGNWTVAPVYIFESPEYAEVQSGTDSNLNGDSFGDRAILNAQGRPGTGTDVIGLDRAGNIVAPSTSKANPIVAYVAKDPSAQYIRAQLGALANTGRNTLATRRINNWDLSLLKNFSITERVKFQFGGSFLNTWNHPQFTPGVLNQVNSVGQSGTGVRNYLIPGNKAFNNPEVTFGSNPRTITLIGKVVF